MKYVNLIWTFDETLTNYPIMTAELLRNAYTAGCRNFLCTHRDYTALNQYLEPFDVYELLEGSTPSLDALEKFLSDHQLAAADSIVLCDRNADFTAALNAGLNCCLFDPKHLYSNELCVDSFCALQELLGI